MKRPSREFVVTLVAVLVVGAVVLIAAAMMRKSAARELDSKLYIAPEVEITREMRWLQEYVRIDTSNPPGNEIEGARFLERILREHGIRSEIVESAPGRASLYARLEGERSGDALMLMHHIDVTPADPADGWRKDPFSGTIEGGYLWGRGALDMKGIGIAHLAAFLEAAESKRRLKRDLVFLAVADEEAGSRAGVRWLLENRPEWFEGVTGCLTEGGITEMVAGELVYFGIEVGAPVLSKWRVVSPTLRDAQRARVAIEPLMDPVEPDVISPAVLEYFRSVAPARQVVGWHLHDVPRALAAGRYYQIPPNYRWLMEVRALVGPISRSGDSFVLPVDVSAPPEIAFEDAKMRLHTLLSDLPVEVQLSDVAPSGPYSSTDTELFETIVRTARKQFGERSAYGPLVISRAETDSRFLRAKGIQCYGFWPYLIDFFLTQTVHGTGERVRLDYYAEGVELMKRIVAESVLE